MVGQGLLADKEQAGMTFQEKQRAGRDEKKKQQPQRGWRGSSIPLRDGLWLLASRGLDLMTQEVLCSRGKGDGCGKGGWLCKKTISAVAAPRQQRVQEERQANLLAGLFLCSDTADSPNRVGFRARL